MVSAIMCFTEGTFLNFGAFNKPNDVLNDSNAINAPNVLNERNRFQKVLIVVSAFRIPNFEIVFCVVSAFRFPNSELP